MKKTNRITAGLGDRWINELEVLMDWFFEKYTDLFCEIMARSGGVGGKIELFDLLEMESFKTYDRAFRSWKWEHFKVVARACDYFKAKSDGELSGHKNRKVSDAIGKRAAPMIARIEKELSRIAE